MPRGQRNHTSIPTRYNNGYPYPTRAHSRHIQNATGGDLPWDALEELASLITSLPARESIDVMDLADHLDAFTGMQPMDLPSVNRTLESIEVIIDVIDKRLYRLEAPCPIDDAKKEDELEPLDIQYVRDLGKAKQILEESEYRFSKLKASMT
ncbi:hypothetical protein VKT23_012948 [Stygiomarasmius scandens]|uniref:Uncharacterized protein n=1 Tax=Marasmiellus scandens TaxID=2682957 RepID=A0ABR1JA83_9AGAR